MSWSIKSYIATAAILKTHFVMAATEALIALRVTSCFPGILLWFTFMETTL